MQVKNILSYPKLAINSEISIEFEVGFEFNVLKNKSGTIIIFFIIPCESSRSKSGQNKKEKENQRKFAIAIKGKIKEKKQIFGNLFRDF